MLKNIKKWLDHKQSHELSPDAKFTIANLMIGMMMADGNVDKVEHDELMQFFTTTFHFSPEKSHRYIEALQNKNHDEALVSACQKIVSTHSIAERENILSIVWSIAFADDKIGSDEEKYITNITKELDIPATTMNALKKKHALKKMRASSSDKIG